jgi:hypothetical protein
MSVAGSKASHFGGVSVKIPRLKSLDGCSMEITFMMDVHEFGLGDDFLVLCCRDGCGMDVGWMRDRGWLALRADTGSRAAHMTIARRSAGH